MQLALLLLIAVAVAPVQAGEIVLVMPNDGLLNWRAGTARIPGGDSCAAVDADSCFVEHALPTCSQMWFKRKWRQVPWQQRVLQ